MKELKKEFSNNLSFVVGATLLLLVSASLLLLAQFGLTLKSFKFIGQGIEFRNTVTVSGLGEVTALPDVAEFSFAVLEEGEEVSLAQAAVTEKMNAILDFLDDFGIPDKDIKTTSYNVTPRYEYPRPGKQIPVYPPSGERVLVGYEVSHWVSVKVREPEKAGEVLSQIGTMGVSNLSGLNFIVDDEEKAMRDARRLAIKDAEEKARALADDLGVRVIKIVGFSESGGPVYFKSYALAEMSRDGGMPPVPEIPAGENTITSNVTITYAIE